MRSLLFLFLSTFTAQYVRAIVPRQSASLGPGPASIVSSSSTIPTSTATSSTPTPSSSSTATLSIHNLTQLTTCQSDNITWSYTGPSPAQITLVLAEAIVNQSILIPPTNSILVTLATGIDATLGSWTWPQVDVPSGYYIIEGAVMEAVSQTEAFFIANGSDTSCIQTQTLTPPVGGSSHSHVGAIVGGAVGGVVVIAAIIIMLLLWRRNRRSHDRHPIAAGRWGGLGSTDDNDPFSGAKLATQARRTESDNDEIYSIDDEKIISSATEPDPLPYTTHHRRTSTQSSFRNSTRHQPTSNSKQPDSIALPVIDTHTESRRRGSVDVADIGRSVSAPGTTRHSQQLTDLPPRADFSTPEKIIRSTSNSSAARRSSRKPVPQYDAADIDTTSVPPHEPGSPNTDSPVNTSKDRKHQSRSGDGRPVHYLIPDLPPASNVA